MILNTKRKSVVELHIFLNVSPLGVRWTVENEPQFILLGRRAAAFKYSMTRSFLCSIRGKQTFPYNFPKG